ncbi:hypothetical protein HHI36_014449 [Cryptolaemus montrouzieri]|uniref:Uncharacterized protein n=1 Tax=Cryptolaemus montrouzieri TaxID=559131 RepID=A0ABD2N3A4_9CUCU
MIINDIIVRIIDVFLFTEGSSRDNFESPDIDTGHNRNEINKSDVVPRSTTAKNIEDTSDEGFKTVTRKRKVIVGTGQKQNASNHATQTKDFLGVEKRASIHLGKVSFSIKKESIERYLAATFNNKNLMVENAKSRSFRVEADYSLLEELYN